MKIRIYYEDTDIGGIVYHSKYINFCERARSELFFEKGLSPIFEDYHFVVKKLEADFIESAGLGEIIEIKTKVIEKKRASLLLEQNIYREKDEKLIFSMKVLLVCMKKDKIAKIPDYFLEVLK
jgi:acyl-CoA thioester hydrolase